MPDNTNTSRGWVLDLISSIANDLALSNHLIENIINQQNKLEQGEIDDTSQLYTYQELEHRVTKLRRDKMRFLIADVEFNKELWCPLKHAIESFMQMSEVYQATGTADALSLMVESNNILAGLISLSLGMELEACMRCVSDKLS
jgi:hypothetical protein